MQGGYNIGPPAPNYLIYTREEDIRIIRQPYSMHRNYWYVTAEQRDFIDSNIHAARGDEHYGKLHCVPHGCINYAGKPVAFEEAVYYAIPYMMEKYKLNGERQYFGNYIIRHNAWSKNTVPYGTWQQVQTLPTLVRGNIHLQGIFHLNNLNTHCKTRSACGNAFLTSFLIFDL